MAWQGLDDAGWRGCPEAKATQGFRTVAAADAIGDRVGDDGLADAGASGQDRVAHQRRGEDAKRLGDGGFAAMQAAARPTLLQDGLEVGKAALEEIIEQLLAWAG